MSVIRLATLVVCLLASSAAHAADVAVSLYLQPLPSEAARLTFAIASVSAVTVTGSEYPLQPNLKTVTQAEASRQRLLASGRLPAGSYAGFLLKVRQASLKSGRQEITLAVPDTPVRIDAPFVASGQQGVLLWTTLNYEESVAEQGTFTPVFSAVKPSRPIAEHAGFVTNSRSNTITVFDKSLAQAVALIDTCANPAGMALDQARRRAFVACAKDDEVRAIDVTTGEMLEHTQASPGDRPRELALTPDGRTLIAVNNGSNSIGFYDAVSLARQERVNVGSAPGSILIDAAGRRAFVFNTMSSSISVIDVANRTLVTTVATEASPLRGRFNARGDRLYVIHERSPYMTVLDPRQLTVQNRVRLRIGVSAIDVDPVRDLIVIGGTNDTSVEFYDPNALLPLYATRTRSGVSYLRIDGENNALYMVSPDTRSLLVARLADRKVSSEIDVGDGPYWVVVMGEK